MDSVRSRSDHASDTREPAPGSKSLFPLYLLEKTFQIDIFQTIGQTIQYKPM
jgi:hypothetical protein